MLNLLGGERIVAGLALALVGCASIAGVGGGSGDDAAEEAPNGANEDTKADPTPASDPSGQTGTNSGGETTQTQTQSQTTPAPTTPAPAPTPAPKKNNGDACTDDPECQSKNCDGGMCKKKPNESIVCAKDGDRCFTEDSCCGASYCSWGALAKCSACRTAGQSPDPLVGSKSCCSGASANGTCK